MNTKEQTNKNDIIKPFIVMYDNEGTPLFLADFEITNNICLI